MAGSLSFPPGANAQRTADAEMEQAGASLEFVTGSPSSHSCANAAIVDDPMTQPLEIPLRSKSLERRGTIEGLVSRATHLNMDKQWLKILQQM